MAAQLRLCAILAARDYVCARPHERVTTYVPDRLNARPPELGIACTRDCQSAQLRMRATARARDDACAQIPERATTYAREFLSARRCMRVTASARDDVYSRRRISMGACSCIRGANLE